MGDSGKDLQSEVDFYYAVWGGDWRILVRGARRLGKAIGIESLAEVACDGGIEADNSTVGDRNAGLNRVCIGLILLMDIPPDRSSSRV